MNEIIRLKIKWKQNSIGTKEKKEWSSKIDCYLKRRTIGRNKRTNTVGHIHKIEFIRFLRNRKCVFKTIKLFFVLLPEEIRLSNTHTIG